MKKENMLLIKCSIVILLLNGIFSQSQDLEFCDIDKIQPDPEKLEIPNMETTAQYQAVFERNAYGITEETVEFYDGLANIGIEVTTEANIKTITYAYFAINELLLIKGRDCQVKLLNESIGSTNFFLVTDQQGNEHIVSPLTIALQRLKFVYIGSGTIRGIPVNQWQTCAYSKEKKRTLRITVSFSNPKKWTSSETSPIPVQTQIESKGQAENDYNSEVLSIFKYKSKLELELEDYFVPSGIYCPGRTSLKKLPPIPKSFSFSNQIAETFVQLNDRNGTIFHFQEDYEYPFKLFRYDYSKGNQAYTEIHDFNTGLNYTINRRSGVCSIGNLTSGSPDSQMNGTYLEIRDPLNFFDVTGSDFQYIGLKRTDGVNTDVWIGKKEINGQAQILEWHFLANTWNRTDIKEENFKTPLKLIIYKDIVLNNPNFPNQNITVTAKFTNNIFNFRPTELNLYEYDIRSCVGNLEKQSLVFSISGENARVIRSNLGRFRRAVVLELQKIARVVLLRITPPQVAFYSDYVIVSFGIIERSSTYGNVVPPENDLILKEAVETVRDYFRSNNIKINFKDDLRNNVTIYSLPNSLNDNFESEGFITYNIERVNKGFSGASVFVLTLIVFTFGTCFGFVIIKLHQINKIKIPFLGR